jgi:hypothetical protein
MHLDLGMALGLEALDHDEVDRRQPPEEVGKARLALLPQLAHERPAPTRGDQHFAGAGATVLERILAGLVDVEGMVRVLDGRDREAAARELGDELDEERRLARPAPSRQPDDAHIHISRITGESLPRT